MSYRKSRTAAEIVAVILGVVGILALVALFSLFEAWLVLTIINWAWPELPAFLSPTFEHIVGCAVVLWVVQAAFKAKVNTKDN